MPEVSGGGGEGGSKAPVEVHVPTGFDHLLPATLRLPEEAGLFNHTLMQLPPIRIYAPIESSRALRTGALEEESVRVKAKIPHQMIAEAGQRKANQENNTGGGSGGSGGGEVAEGSTTGTDASSTGGTHHPAEGGHGASSLSEGNDPSSKVD